MQDVLIPWRGVRPKDKEEHFEWLRQSILLVVVLIFLWSWLAPTRDYVFMFMQLSGSIWIAGSGSLIIGGLYWKRGNTNAAWAAMVTGSVGGFLGLFLKIGLGDAFPFNGQEINIYTCVLSLSCYVACGFVYPPDEGCKLVERLEAEIAAVHAAEQSGNTVAGLQQAAQKALGVGDAAFTPADRALSTCLVALGVCEPPACQDCGC